MQNWRITKDAANMTGEPMADVDSNNPGGPSTVHKRDNVVESSKGAEIGDPGFASFSHPKLKFNFTMRITLRVPVRDNLVIGSSSMREMNIPLKSVTRPRPSINMVPMNFYNFRTQIATKVDYGTATVNMYDDGDGNALSIYNTYMRAISPIAGVSDDTLIHNPQSVPFGQMSSLGPLPNNPNGIIKSLSVFHHYVSRDRDRVVEYKYLNPKIQNFDLDELNMSESDVTSIGMTFVYDGVVTIDRTNEDFSNVISGAV